MGSDETKACSKVYDTSILQYTTTYEKNLAREKLLSAEVRFKTIRAFLYH